MPTLADAKRGRHPRRSGDRPPSTAPTKNAAEVPARSDPRPVVIRLGAVGEEPLEPMDATSQRPGRQGRGARPEASWTTFEMPSTAPKRTIVSRAASPDRASRLAAAASRAARSPRVPAGREPPSGRPAPCSRRPRSPRRRAAPVGDWRSREQPPDPGRRGSRPRPWRAPQAARATPAPASVKAPGRAVTRRIPILTGRAKRRAAARARSFNTGKVFLQVSKAPRYDLPKAAPPPLRLVQLFVNTVDLEHEREWLDDPDALLAWARERNLVPAGTKFSRRDLRHALELREAFRALLGSNREGKQNPAALRTVCPRCELGPACCGVCRRWVAGTRAEDRGCRRPVRTARRGCLRRDAGRELAAIESLPQLPLGILRRVEEPIGPVVLDGALWQPAEDPRLPEPAAPSMSRPRLVHRLASRFGPVDELAEFGRSCSSFPEASCWRSSPASSTSGFRCRRLRSSCSRQRRSRSWSPKCAPSSGSVSSR